MFTQNVETIEHFSSCMVPVKVGRAYTGEHINIMVQALQTKDSSFPQGLTIQNTYMELRGGSKETVVVVRNSTAYPQDPPEENPSGLGQLQHSQCPNHPLRFSCRRGVTRPQDPPYPQIDCQAKTWETIWWTGFEWVGLLAPRAGRFHLPAPGQIPWCVFVGSSRIGLYPHYRTQDKSNRWHSL